MQDNRTVEEYATDLMAIWIEIDHYRLDMVVLFCSFKLHRALFFVLFFLCAKIRTAFRTIRTQFAHNSHNPNKIHTVYKIRTNSHNSHNWNKIRTIHRGELAAPRSTPNTSWRARGWFSGPMESTMPCGR